MTVKFAKIISIAVRTLKDEEGGRSRQWSNQGQGNNIPLRVSLTPSDTGTKPGSFTTCRDLTTVFVIMCVSNVIRLTPA